MFESIWNWFLPYEKNELAALLYVQFCVPRSNCNESLYFVPVNQFRLEFPQSFLPAHVFIFKLSSDNHLTPDFALQQCKYFAVNFEDYLFDKRCESCTQLYLVCTPLCFRRMRRFKRHYIFLITNMQKCFNSCNCRHVYP